MQTFLEDLQDPITEQSFLVGKTIAHTEQIGADLKLGLHVGYACEREWPLLSRWINQHWQKEHAGQCDITWKTVIEPHAVTQGLARLPAIKNIVAVASGKGGVGKSTTAVNLSLALASQGAKVGLLDADIYGPSQAMMLGLEVKLPEAFEDNTMKPFESHGVFVMSMAFLVAANQAVIWRGPMVSQALMQLLNQTRWPELDYLIVDMPPGTGDIALTLSQKVPLTAGIIVTTPQDIALIDARRAALMFGKVSVPVLGLVENMATHTCTQCGHVDAIFGQGGGKRLSEELGIRHLGSLPLDASIQRQADQGTPTVVSHPDSELATTYQRIAIRMAAQLATLSRDFSSKLASIPVVKT